MKLGEKIKTQLSPKTIIAATILFNYNTFICITKYENFASEKIKTLFQKIIIRNSIKFQIKFQLQTQS